MRFCFYHKRVIQWNCGEGNLPRGTANHIARCQSCHSFYHESVELTSVLRSAHQEVEVPPFLASRIKAHSHGGGSAAALVDWRRMATTACAVSAIALLAVKFGPDAEDLLTLTGNNDAIEEDAAFQIPKFPRVSTLANKIDDPLELEIQRVIQDTRQAYQYLASNFLPSNFE